MTLSIVGSAIHAASSNTTASVALTTTAPAVICVVLYTERPATLYPENAPPVVTGVTSDGLTFTRRVRSHGSQSSNLEMWCAVAPDALTSAVITATFDIAFDDLSGIAFGVGGCNTAAPFDPDASLPATVTPAAGTGGGIVTIDASTALSNDILIWAAGTSVGSTTPVPDGFTGLGPSNNAGGYYYSYMNVGYKIVSAPVSDTYASAGSWLDRTSGSLQGFLDALTADAGSPPPAATPGMVLVLA